LEIDAKAISNYVKSQERFKGEIASYWQMMNKLPEYDYSKFYAVYKDYENNILQGDGLTDLKFIKLPNEKVSTGRGIVISNSCDIEQENKRKFPSRIIYAPLIKLSAYEAMLRSAKKGKQSLYTKDEVDLHMDDIRKQRIGQIFYLPSGKELKEEALLFFDDLCTSDNSSISRDNLAETRVFSLSAYGWHIFLERLAHFFTKLSDETVELRFNPNA